MAFLVLVLMAMGNAVPARMVSADPASGAVLDKWPGSVSLTFTGVLDAQQTHVVVSRTDGTRVADGALRVDGGTARLPVTAGGPGLFLVGYHATLTNGRQVSGVVRFTVKGDAGADVRSPRTGSDGDHGHAGVDPVSGVVLVANTVLVIVLVVLLAWRRHPRTAQQETRPVRDAYDDGGAA